MKRNFSFNGEKLFQNIFVLKICFLLEKNDSFTSLYNSAIYLIIVQFFLNVQKNKHLHTVSF